MNQLYRLILILLMGLCSAKAQTITGNISDQSGNALPFASIYLAEEKTGTSADDQGNFELKLPGNKETYTLRISFMGFLNQEIKINPDQLSKTLEVKLEELPNTMDEVVVSGTLKAMSKMASPVPVEVYSPAFFKKNPTTNVYEALQNVNGVRPQLNCQVCNTGDIHINGLEGPYTMVLIDGMPIVSSLATVYGLSGIPNSIIERMEVVKGPASSLYGSEAIGGLINIITTDPATAPMFSLDLMSTTWLEHNIDLSGRFTLGDKVDVLTGINYFNYDNPVDLNKDNFTDLALQERFSLFQKYRIKRDHGRLFTLAGRYYTENRWGGEMQWTSEDKGGTDVYGETIQTERWEAMGQYQLPFEEKLLFSFSANGHYQDSAYGDLLYVADQKIGFGQLTWDQENQHHNWLAGTAVRYTYYDDNSPATEIPQSNFLPGIFLQDLIKFSEKNELLLGARWDYHMEHGNIFTPRIAYKRNFSPDAVFRVNAGTGFRVVNLFTEDHAALTGSRDVVILEDLKPEQSYNINLNFSQRYYL
ncbi:MAG: TonB-dependent receptor, partial [Flavobacteriaceae bacterium]